MKKTDKHIAQFKDQKAFDVPDNYFDEFAHKMQSEIGDSAVQSRWYHKLTDLIHPRLSIPVSLALVLAYIAFTSNFDQETDQLISDQDIQAYLMSEFEDDNQIYELALEEGFVESESVLIDDDDLIEYLIEEDEIDIQLINDFI